MFKTATAAILSATIALGAMAPAPAQAEQRNDIAGLIFGAAALALIVNELKDKERETTSRKPVIRGQIAGRNGPGRGGVITPHRPRHAAIVPASCRRIVSTPGGNRRLFGVPCLRRAGIDMSDLPRRCLRRVDLPRRTVNAYPQACLRNAGVRIRN